MANKSRLNRFFLKFSQMGIGLTDGNDRDFRGLALLQNLVKAK